MSTKKNTNAAAVVDYAATITEHAAAALATIDSINAALNGIADTNRAAADNAVTLYENDASAKAVDAAKATAATVAEKAAAAMAEINRALYNAAAAVVVPSLVIACDGCAVSALYTIDGDADTVPNGYRRVTIADIVNAVEISVPRYGEKARRGNGTPRAPRKPRENAARDNAAAIIDAAAADNGLTKTVYNGVATAPRYHDSDNSIRVHAAIGAACVTLSVKDDAHAALKNNAVTAVYYDGDMKYSTPHKYRVDYAAVNFTAVVNAIVAAAAADTVKDAAAAVTAALTADENDENK